MATAADLKKFLDKKGLTYFWAKIKNYIDVADSHKVTRYDCEPTTATSICGWKIGVGATNGKAMSCIASIRSGSIDTLVSISSSADGKVSATGLSGDFGTGTLDAGISADGSVYIYSDDTTLPNTATITLIEVSNPDGAICSPVPVAHGSLPEMETISHTDWVQDKRVDFIMSIIPDEATPLNKLVDHALLEFEATARESADTQLQAQIDVLESERHSHENKGLLDNYGAAGTSSVPVYISTDGTPTACEDDFARDSDMEAEQRNRDSADTALMGRIKSIEALIPNAAQASNQLADKQYVDDLGERLEAHYLGCTPEGAPFPTYYHLFPPEGSDPPVFFYQGKVVQPNENDVTVVTDDEVHTSTIDPDNHATTRYRYDGHQWTFEYVINNNALSILQLLAINSGINTEKVEAYDDHISNRDKHVLGDDRVTWNNKVSQDQLTAEINSRIAGDMNALDQLAAESSARMAAVNAEAEARMAAITSLDERIKALEKKGLVVNNHRLGFG